MNSNFSPTFYEKAFSLYRCLSTPTELREILKVAYNIFKKPLILSDYTHNVIAEYHEENITDSRWAELINLSIYPIDWIDNDFHLSIKNLFKKEIITHKLDSKGVAIVGSIFQDNTCYGFLSLLDETETFSDEDYHLFEIFLTILGVCLSKEEHLKFSNNYQASLLSDLLDKKITDSETLKNRLSYRNWTPKLMYRAMYIDITPGEHVPPFSYILKHLNTISPQVIAIKYENNILTLVESNNEKYLDILCEEIYRKIEKMHLEASISNIFSDLLDLPSLYEDAKQTLYIGKQLSGNKSLYFFEDIQLELFFHSVKKSFYWEKYCPPAISVLQKYDSEYHCDLSKTLYIYLKTGRNFTKSGKILNLHKNTVMSRIEKIKNIINNNLSNDDFMFQLLLFYELIYMES